LAAFSLLVVCYAVLTYQRNKVWKDEVSLWSDVIRKSPSKARAYSDRGHAYHLRGDLDPALQDYSKALELRPDLVGTYYNRAIVYQLKGDLDRALRDYDKAIELFPEYPQALYNRAVVFFERGEYAKSREDLRRAQALGFTPDPRFVEGLRKISGAGE
jgi:tetratricopeptide (TPR) repeat protein